MPFDAGLLHAITNELSILVGARVDKIYQPEKDEIVLYLRGTNENYKLLICATAGRARVALTDRNFENPQNPPMFCMLLRKHLSGGHVLNIEQLGFDRVFQITVSSHDEMGFVSNKYIVAEIMGKYSNIIFLDNDRKILFTLRTIDIMSNYNRAILPGFVYAPPAPQEGKLDPFNITKEDFFEIFSSFDPNFPIHKGLLSKFLGFSPLIAREIAFRSTKSIDTIVANCDKTTLFFYFESIMKVLKENKYSPFIVYNKENIPFEFSFIDIYQYGSGYLTKQPLNFKVLMDIYFAEKDEKDRINVRAHDVLQLLSNASARLNKKIALQKSDLIACADKEKNRIFGDLITANIYLLKRGMEKCELLNYISENQEIITINLDKTLTPSQNAQKYYKKYNKSKSAEENLKIQINEAEKELNYIDSVFESLTKAENEKDLSEIRNELSSAGYGKKLTALYKSNNSLKKQNQVKLSKNFSPMSFKTTNGYTVLCGKNNFQNDYVTFTLAEKTDYWFHVKNMPGSHTVLVCKGTEPPAEDFTDAAIIAAYYSSGKKIPNVAIDYSYVKNIKKPSGSAPGFVIYETNYSAYVTADEEKVLKMKI